MPPCSSTCKQALLHAARAPRWVHGSLPSLPLRNGPLSAASRCSRRALSTVVSAAELQFGQPLHETHPHLLASGELTPGIAAAEYAQRRSRLAAQLPRNSVAVLAAADVKFRSGAVFYDFQQESNFFYLTGFDEPDAVAVIGKGASADDHELHLFVRPKDSRAEMWEGPRSGLQAALDVFNADYTGDISQLSRHLRPLLQGAAEVYTDIPPAAAGGATSSLVSRLFGRPAAAAFGELGPLLERAAVKPLRPLVHAQRLTKSAAELAAMHRAGSLSGRAFNHAMRRAWRDEADLAAFLDYRFRQLGCSGSAYIPVVAGGAHALTIHYVRNDARFAPQDLALVDAGGQIGHYVADITRTFPLAARFTAAQRDLYSAVLDVQRSCVALCRTDAGLSLDKLHSIAEHGLKDALARLGFDTGRRGAMETLFPHHLGHYVGLDVHDCPGSSRREPLQEGQCVTIEPGVYVPDDERWPATFRGLGIRIEDCVAVGNEKPLVLTAEAAKGVQEIEELRAEQIELKNAQELR